MACYKLLQMTNNALGAVAASATLPLGTVTRRIATTTGGGVPFNVYTSGADTVELTAPGYYRITYNISAVAGAAGIVGVNLLAGGSSVASQSATAASGDTVNISLSYMVRVFANCNSCPTNCPLPLQLQLSTTAITGGVGNLIVERMVA